MVIPTRRCSFALQLLFAAGVAAPIMLTGEAQAQSISTNFTGDSAFLDQRNVGAFFNITVYGIISAPPGAPYSNPPQSPFTGGHVNIWRGAPGDAGSTIVGSASQLLESGWSGAYRVLNNAALDDPRHPVMFIRMGFCGLHLPPKRR